MKTDFQHVEGFARLSPPIHLDGFDLLVARFFLSPKAIACDGLFLEVVESVRTAYGARDVKLAVASTDNHGRESWGLYERNRYDQKLIGWPTSLPQIAAQYGISEEQLESAALVASPTVEANALRVTRVLVRDWCARQLTDAQALKLWQELRAHLLDRGLADVVDRCGAAVDGVLGRDDLYDLRTSLALIFTKHPWPSFPHGQPIADRFYAALQTALALREFAPLEHSPSPEESGVAQPA